MTKMQIFQRIAVTATAVALAVGLSAGMTAQAEADPVSDVGAAGYQSLFNANVPVFEVTGIEHFADDPNFRSATSGFNPTRGDGQFMHLRRVPNARAGHPWMVKYAIAGRAVPNQFYLPANLATSGGILPWVLTDPKPACCGYPYTNWTNTGIMILQVGPVAIPGVPGPSIAGAVAVGG